MNILVCIKQVPDAQEVTFDPDTAQRKEGAALVVNPFDTYALETAVRIKDSNPDTTVTVLSVGEKQAEEALKTCLAVGADQAWLVSDPAFAGSDTLAISRVLAAAIRNIEAESGAFDILFFGNQATDGDTAQVGPQTAELLGIPQVTYGVDASDAGDRVEVKQESDAGYTVISVSKPCLVAITQTSFEPRYPTIKSKLAAKKVKVPVLTAADLGLDPDTVGTAGSVSAILEAFLPPKREGGIVIDEGSAEESTVKLAHVLSDRGFI